jgi:outer membrane protein assembly factor BamB
MQSVPKSFRGTRRWLPALWAGVIALAMGSAEAAPISGRLVALRKATGTPFADVSIWRTAEGATGSAAVGGCWAFYIEDGQTLCALNLISGKKPWSTRLKAPVSFPPLACGSLALVHDGTTLWAYTNTTGRLMWELPMQDIGEKWELDGTVQGVLAEGRLYLCAGSKILAVDAGTGQPIWANHSVAMAASPTPTVAAGYLYVRSAADPATWVRFTADEGMPAPDENAPSKSAAVAPPATPTPSATRVTLAADRRSVTVTLGTRRWSYRAPAPFTIAGVIGETSNVLCVQLVAESPLAARQN